MVKKSCYLLQSMWKPAFIVLTITMMLVIYFTNPPATRASDQSGVWGSKPLLEYYLLDQDTAARLQADLGLTQSELQTARYLAMQEASLLRNLEAESLHIIGDANLTIADKRKLIERSAYNQRLLDIVKSSQSALEKSLEPGTYASLVNWIENEWLKEQGRLTQPRNTLDFNSVFPNTLGKSYPRTYEVYATRYDAGGAYYIALPDKCLKFANGGAMRCSDGYQYGQNYSVAVTYKGKTVYATVGESGPWNVDDNYWSTVYDPQPRRMFADLPLGMPEAQAAYFNGYNGGLDQYGRMVKSPVAIDISYAVAADLGLPSGNNKVTVTFLWTEGWDNADTNPIQTTVESGTAPAPAETAIAVVPFVTTTPNPDGSIVHVVQQGQTLIGIATVYGVQLNALLERNRLTMDSIILPGDNILVKRADPTQTLTTEEIIVTPTPSATLSPRAYESIQETSTHIPEVTDPVKTPVDGIMGINNSEPLIIIIAAVAVIGVALILVGLLSKRRV
ncbi:MAG: LysM peptidoglycan-binding domain-containing protein [Chloroflexota bacterium]|nr:LysM peptidoglycan-binding domain-containing protein [Chloroflexota bacterium]